MWNHPWERPPPSPHSHHSRDTGMSTTNTSSAASTTPYSSTSPTIISTTSTTVITASSSGSLGVVTSTQSSTASPFSSLAPTDGTAVASSNRTSLASSTVEGSSSLTSLQHSTLTSNVVTAASSTTATLAVASTSLVNGPAASITPVAAIRSHSSKAKIIAGAVSGGVVLFLVILALCFRKALARRLKSMRGHRTAPSAEFMNHTSLSMPFQNRSFSTSPRPLLQRESPTFLAQLGESHYRDQPPPPFTPGLFTDPVLEKISQAAQQRQEQMRQPPALDAARVASGSNYSFGQSSTSHNMYEVDDHTVPSTSPILADGSDMGHSSSEAHGKGLGSHTRRASESVEGGKVGWAL